MIASNTKDSSKKNLRTGYFWDFSEKKQLLSSMPIAYQRQNVPQYC